VTADSYNFTKSQLATLSKLLDPENDVLWAELLGGFITAGGRGEPSQDRIPTGMFTWPLEVPGRISSFFGYRKHPITGETSYHSGMDLAAPSGTPILATADGTVTIANSTDSYGGGFGYHVRIKHKDGYDTLFAHCSKLAVKSGDKVIQGQIIAYVGSTGRSTGPHLHWEIYKGGKRIDPLGFFR
jgi:murein DD-endopeptidase MepM/ murein hydrolase activator NlpD